jgi:hypothetical protein
MAIVYGRIPLGVQVSSLIVLYQSGQDTEMGSLVLAEWALYGAVRQTVFPNLIQRYVGPVLVEGAS